MILSCLLLLGVSAQQNLHAQPAVAQPPAAPTTEQRIASTGRRGFLYLATRAKQHFYLYGAAIASNEALFPFNAVLVDALRKSQVLIIDRDPNWAVTEAISNASLPPEQSLSLILSPIMLALTRQALGAMGIAAGPTERLKPWLVAESLAQEQAERLGFHADHATVRILLAYARNAGLKVEQLAPADADVRIYNSMPMEVQIARLAQVLGDLNTTRGEQKVRLYTESWANADEAGMQREMALQQQPTYSAFTQWYWVSYRAQHLQELADSVQHKLPTDGAAIVVVPALDLVGPSGLLRAFTDRGFTLRNLQP